MVNLRHLMKLPAASCGEFGFVGFGEHAISFYLFDIIFVFGDNNSTLI